MQKTTGPVFVKNVLKSALLVSTACLGLSGHAAATTLSETVRSAIETNPEVAVVAADRRAVDQELRQARAGYLPSVDVRGAAGPEYSDNTTTRANRSSNNTKLRREAQLTLSQMLFDGFETQSEVARQRSRVDSAAYRVEETSEFVALDAIEAHLDVLRNQQIVELNLGNIETHRRILAQVVDLEESGAGDIADVRQTESRLATAQENYATSAGALADAEAAYIRAVGLHPDDLQPAVSPLAALPADREEAALIASSNSPTVKIAAADVDVSTAELRGSRSGFYPRLDIELLGSLADDVDGVSGDDDSASALAVVTYNLYRGGADIAREREAFHRSNEARALLRQVRRDAEEEARIAFNALETARARTAALRDRVEAQRRTRDAYGAQFDIGQRDLLDLLDSENELLLARVSLVTAQLTEQFAVYRVLAVVGSLIDTIEVAVPRESISILRTPEDVQTPEAIESKSDELANPRSEPRPVRGEESGEPPVDALDASSELNMVEIDETDLSDEALLAEATEAEASFQAASAQHGTVSATSIETQEPSVGSSALKAQPDWENPLAGFFSGLFASNENPNLGSMDVAAMSRLESQARGTSEDVRVISEFLDEIAQD